MTFAESVEKLERDLRKVAAPIVDGVIVRLIDRLDQLARRLGLGPR